MSKLAAQKKAEQKRAKRKAEEVAKQKRIEREKLRQKERAEAHKKLNQEKAVERSVKVAKEMASKHAAFSSPRQQAAYNDVVKLIKDDHQLALDFVLEEIEAASKGNDSAKRFAAQSGFTPDQYNSKMERSLRHVEVGPQQLLHTHSMTLMAEGEIDQAVKLRLAVVDAVMQRYLLGKYAPATIRDKEPVDALFAEYTSLCRNPNSNGAVALLQEALECSKLISAPSSKLRQHLLQAEIMVMQGDKLKTKKIPDNILANLITDLSWVCLCRDEYFVRPVNDLLARGISKSKLERALDLGRHFGEYGKGVTNHAPTIHNLITLLYKQLPKSQKTPEYDKLMWDDSFVTGATQGHIATTADYQAFIYDAVGLPSPFR